jgi:hypothetical protein
MDLNQLNHICPIIIVADRGSDGYLLTRIVGPDACMTT